MASLMTRTRFAGALLLISIRANGMTVPVTEVSVGRPESNEAAHPLLDPIAEANIALPLIAERRVILGVPSVIRRHRNQPGKAHKSFAPKRRRVNVAKASI